MHSTNGHVDIVAHDDQIGAVEREGAAWPTTVFDRTTPEGASKQGQYGDDWKKTLKKIEHRQRRTAEDSRGQRT
jgi:hypothetical protein